MYQYTIVRNRYGDEVPFTVDKKTGEIVIVSTNPKDTDETCFVSMLTSKTPLKNVVYSGGFYG